VKSDAEVIFVVNGSYCQYSNFLRSCLLRSLGVARRVTGGGSSSVPFRSPRAACGDTTWSRTSERAGTCGNHSHCTYMCSHASCSPALTTQARRGSRGQCWRERGALPEKIGPAREEGWGWGLSGTRFGAAAAPRARFAAIRAPRHSRHNSKARRLALRHSKWGERGRVRRGRTAREGEKREGRQPFPPWLAEVESWEDWRR
jgi:hypothetical protein